MCVYTRCIFFLPSKGVDSSPQSQKSQYTTLRNTNILVVTSVLFCVDFLTEGKYALPKTKTPMQCNQVKPGYLSLKRLFYPFCNCKIVYGPNAEATWTALLDALTVIKCILGRDSLFFTFVSSHSQ